MFGRPDVPHDLSGLSAEGAGLTSEDVALLTEHVATTAGAGGGFSMPVRAQGSSRVHLVQASPAPPPYPPSATILWFTDATDSEEQVAAMRAEVGSLKGALDALSALIEAAPFPMWPRGPDLRLALVHRAYVAAVEADAALSAVNAGLPPLHSSAGRQKGKAGVK